MVSGKELMKERDNGMSIRAICNKYNISTRRFYQEVIPEGYVIKENPDRTTYYRPMPSKDRDVQNKVLLGLIMTVSYKKTLEQLADDLGVSVRTIERWIYDGVIPKDENLKRVCSYFNYPPQVLFYYPGERSELT